MNTPSNLESPAFADRPMDLEFLLMAQQFFEAYLILKQRLYPIDWAAYFNFGHALELGMKSLLVTHGVAPERLAKKYGHRLDKLMLDCERKGLIFTARQKECVILIGETHAAYWSRYPKPDWSSGGVAVVGQFEHEAIAILNAASTIVRGAPMFGETGSSQLIRTYQPGRARV